MSENKPESNDVPEETPVDPSIVRLRKFCALTKALFEEAERPTDEPASQRMQTFGLFVTQKLAEIGLEPDQAVIRDLARELWGKLIKHSPA